MYNLMKFTENSNGANDGSRSGSEGVGVSMLNVDLGKKMTLDEQDETIFRLLSEFKIAGKDKESYKVK